MRRVFRSLQTLFPSFQDYRYKLQFLFRKIIRRPHEKDFNALKLFVPKENEVYIDIGSNRGEAIQSMLMFSNHATKIIGFEPNPLVFKKLEGRYGKLNITTLYKYGLSNVEGTFILYVPFYRKWMFDGLSSLGYDLAKNWLNENRMWRFDPNRVTVKEVECQLKRLDDFELSPYFMKIDVQGNQFKVLQGAENTIKKHEPVILIESINNEITAFLEDYGYSFYTFSKNHFTKGHGKPNTFCLTDTKYANLIGTNTKAITTKLL